jgi:uncharacterized cupin superfamily protein
VRRCSAISDEFNLYGEEWDGEQDRDGFRWRSTRVGARLSAERIGATLYELAPGQRTFPYHFHHGNEEWALVVTGSPTLRIPEGERELRPGDVVCFPEGPDGAHALENRTQEMARVLLFSTRVRPSISVYPESGKIATRGTPPEDTLNFKRSDAVDYWEGE